LTTGVVDTGGKFTAGVFDTGGKFTAGVVELSGLLRIIFIKHLALPKKLIIQDRFLVLKRRLTWSFFQK